MHLKLYSVPSVHYQHLCAVQQTLYLPGNPVHSYHVQYHAHCPQLHGVTLHYNKRLLFVYHPEQPQTMYQGPEENMSLVTIYF